MNMKILNEKAITTAYWRFMGRFIVLMISLVAILFTFLKTLTEQVHLLSINKERYDAVLFTQRMMAQKTDSLYRHMSMLNTGLLRSDPLMEQRIIREKNELDTMLVQLLFERRPHEVYRKLSAYVNEMLLLKDSIRGAEVQIKDIRRELNDCQQRERQK